MHTEDLTIHALRLKPGQDIRKEIEMYVQQKKISAGWMATCVGSLTQLHIRFANQSGGATTAGHFEIVSLTGTVSVNGCHLHISVSDGFGQTTGGHLLYENIVYTTAEIIMGESKRLVFTREKDAATSWMELCIKKRSEDQH